MHADRAADAWGRHMRVGNFAAAWEICDRVLAERRGEPCSHLPRHVQWVWDGSPVDGRDVLVRCYHGLGDTIQFIRYAALLKRVAAEVIVWVQPSLIPLLRGVSGIDRLMPLHDGVPEVEYDVDVELGELPYVFRTTMARIPADVPYIYLEPAKLESNGRLRVGLIWESGDWDTRRSIPFSQLQRLASQAPGIEWHILQREPLRAGWDGKLGVISGGDNPLDDARVMRALDLVISVDTMTAHLSGALGQKTWTLLPFDSDWRWMLDRSDSPWYPTMRLFRQPAPRRWDLVIDQLITQLG